MSNKPRIIVRGIIHNTQFKDCILVVTRSAYFMNCSFTNVRFLKNWTMMFMSMNARPLFDWCHLEDCDFSRFNHLMGLTSTNVIKTT